MSRRGLEFNVALNERLYNTAKMRYLQMEFKLKEM
nr:MAG TPA: hypothetical protein [Inoviridae sp.]